MKWNDQQKKAIKSRERNLLLSAGAGSGKTAVLTQRIISLVLEGTPLKRLLVMTFTKAAASEMRQRITAQLESIATSKTRPANEISIARDELNNFHQANISTIDSFCTKLLRRHFNEAGIDPNFRIADENQAQLIMRKCISDILEEAYSSDDTQSLELLEEAFCDYKNPVDSLMLEVYFFMHSLSDPWIWLEKSVEMYNLDFDSFTNSVFVEQTIQNDLKELKTALECEIKVLSAMNSAVKNDERVTDTFIKNTNANVEFIKSLADIYSSGDARAAFAPIEKHSFGTFAGYKSADDSIRALRAQASECIKALRKSKSTPIEKKHEQINSMYLAIKRLAELLEEFHARYSSAKQDKRLLDFSDLSHKTLAVIKNEDIAQEYKKRYSGIFIDEYQDSNLVQETLINRISSENSLFFVGDVKQSIYRFRSAEPSLFMDRSKKYHDSIDGERIDLTVNYRSAANIIHCVNDVFSRTMPIFGELEYGESEKLTPGHDISENPEPSRVTLLINDSDYDSDISDLTNFEKEALTIAADIQKRMTRPIWDNKKKIYREIAYSDIVILSRTGKGNAETLTRILSREGIPAFAALSRGYFEALEVEAFINLLKIIDNKRNDLALLSVMRSGIVGYTDEDIVALRMNYPRATHKTIYDAFMASTSENSALGEHSRSLLRLLCDAKELSQAVRIDQLLMWLIEECNYDIMISAQPLGEQRLANVEKLVEHSIAFESYSSGGLHGFLRFVEDLRNSGRDMGEAVLSGEGSDSVRIMTIHNSKGLEYPVVYLCDIGKKINTSDTSKKLILHRKLGIGASYFNISSRYRTRTLYQDIISAHILDETVAEELRMLYVAMTRAEEELYIYGTINLRNLNSRKTAWLNKRGKSSLLDFIMGSVIAYPQADAFRQSLDAENAVLEEYDGLWALAYKKNPVHEFVEESMSSKQRYVSWSENALKENYSELEKRYSWNYPIITTPSKTTVSNLSAGRLSFDETPKFIAPTHMTAADKGVAVHLALEHLNWSADLSQSGISSQIGVLLESEIITFEQAESIDISLLVKFCSSELGARIANAEIFRREWPFTAIFSSSNLFDDEQEAPSDVVLQGVIDAAFWDGEGWVIVDYKSDRVFDTSPLSLQKIAHKHQKQVALYSEALSKITRQKVSEGFIYLLNAGEAIKVV